MTLRGMLPHVGGVLCLDRQFEGPLACLISALCLPWLWWKSAYSLSSSSGQLSYLLDSTSRYIAAKANMKERMAIFRKEHFIVR